MSLALYGQGVTDVRGSVSGTTMSRSRWGSTHRAKTSPIQPKSHKQGLRRSLLGFLSQYWGAQLTPSERNQWNSYALTYPQTNVFGQTVYLTGHQLFVRLNFNLLTIGASTINVPPAATSQAGLSSLSLMTDHAGAGTFLLTYTAPALSGTAYLYLFATNNQSPGISYVNNKFRLIGYTAYAAGPLDFISQWKVTFDGVPPKLGRKQFVLASIMDSASGLVSAGIIASAIAV